MFKFLVIDLDAARLIIVETDLPVINIELCNVSRVIAV